MNRLASIFMTAAVSLCVCLCGCGGTSGSAGTYSSSGGSDDYESGTSSDYENTEEDNTEWGITSDDSQYEDEAYSFPMSMMGSLDGVFIMKQSEDKLTQLPEEMSHKTVYAITGYTNSEGGLFGYIGSTYADPLEVCRPNEKLVLLGHEWGGRAENDKERITVHACDLLGYTAKYLMDDGRFDPTEVEDLSGATVIEYDYGRLDKAHVMVADRKGATCSYGEYVGTTFEEQTEEMLNPVYFVYQNETTVLDIIVTRDGYCEVDISPLEPGLYVLSSYSGMFPFVVSGDGSSTQDTEARVVQEDYPSDATSQDETSAPETVGLYADSSDYESGTPSSTDVIGGEGFDTQGWITVSGPLVRLEQTTSDTGMGWSRVVYGISFSRPMPFTYTDAFGNTAQADLDFIAVDVVEQYGDDADSSLSSVYLDKWDPYVGQEMVVSGRLFDTGNAHTVGPVMLVDTEINAWPE